MTDGERASAFLSETYRRRVERVERFHWGELVATPTLPLVYDANFAIVTEWDDTAAALGKEMERVQAAAGFAHRKTVIPEEALANALWPAIARYGWGFAGRYMLMAHRRPPDRDAEPAVDVVEVGDDDWARGRQAMMELEGNRGETELGRQLLGLDRRISAALSVTYFAAVVDGEVASYAGVYLEDGVAQIEDVATLPAYRNRGLARSVVLHAAVEARRAGAELVFLVADAADWPKDLYARLGFDPVGVEHVFGRSGRQHSSG